MKLRGAATVAPRKRTVAGIKFLKALTIIFAVFLHVIEVFAYKLVSVNFYQYLGQKEKFLIISLTV